MILITGATGLVGGHLLYRFRESAHLIKPIYRDQSSLEKTRLIFSSYRPEDAGLVDNFNWVKADILDLPSIEQAMQGVKQVYHCAATLEADSFRQMKQVNVTGTKNVLNVSLAAGVHKFCHVSSIAALGDPVGDKLVSEDDYFNLDGRNTYYAISKFGAEMEVWRATQEGMRIIIVNPGVILGEGEWNHGSGQFFSRSHSGNRFYTTGSSGFVDVRNVVEIMYRLMQGDHQDERYVLVGENLSFKQVLSSISRALGKKPPSTKLPKSLLLFLSAITKPIEILGWKSRMTFADVETYTSKTVYNNTKIRTALDYTFTPIEDTIKRVATFYLKNSG